MLKRILQKIRPLVSAYHFLFSFLGAAYYRFPSSKIKVFAVTGTNGKTTTVDLASRIFKEAGYKVAAFSSVKFEIAGEEKKNLFKMTMPGRAVIQSLLRKAVSKGCEVAIMEVTSEGIKQHRHRFINFAAVCFTNLSPEHIESHGGFENYKREKGKLFKAAKTTHIINTDDEHSGYFLGFKSKEKICYGARGVSPREDCRALRATDIKSSYDGINFVVESTSFNLKLKGSFNVYNALAATSFASLEGIKLEVAARALSNAKVIPGRMEEIISSPFKVIVDYAVTPVTLEAVYKEISDHFDHERIIAVLGSCGGGRDKWKRPVLGEIAAEYCDRIIVTNEDPYDEDPEEIIEEVISGTKGKGEKIIDRRKAIGEAIKGARERDVIIVTGKGNEPWLCLEGGKKIPWSEKEVIEEEFNKNANK